MNWTHCHCLIVRSWSSFQYDSLPMLWIPWTYWKIHLCFSRNKSRFYENNHLWKKHSMNTLLKSWMTWDCICLSGLSPIFLSPWFHYLEMVSLHYSLTHILCKWIQFLLQYRVYLILICLQLVVLYPKKLLDWKSCFEPME